MANADLDATIRQLAKQQHKALTGAVNAQRDRYLALAAKSKDAASKRRYKQLAKDALDLGTATVKRLQMSADNAAYSYARAIRQAAAVAAANKPEPGANKPGKNAAKKTDKTAARRPARKAKA
jgi:hypothetical protein